MKKSRFTYEQIIGLLRQAEAGIPSSSFAAAAVLAMPLSTNGGPSTLEFNDPSFSA